MRARIITTLPGLLELQPHWNRLLEASQEATPWQGFDFISNWWEHLGSRQHALRVVVVEKDGTPCMILPLQISVWPWMRLVPVHILEPIGSIMDVNRPRLALGPWDVAAFDCALQAVWSMRTEWQTLRIDEKLPGDPEVKALQAFASRQRVIFRQSFSHLIPHLDLRTGWEAFMAGRSAKLRKNLRAARRKLEARGTVSLRDYRTPAQVTEAYGIVLALNQRSWKQRAKVEHGQSDDYRRFHINWLLAMAGQGRARVLVLTCNADPVAATIALMDGTTYYSAQIVHDAGYGECSPGTLLESMELEELMRDQQYATYDMLGSFLSNKLRWTDTSHWTTHVFVTQRGLRGWLLDAYYFRLKPALRPKLLPLLRLIRKNRGAYETPRSGE